MRLARPAVEGIAQALHEFHGVAMRTSASGKNDADLQPGCVCFKKSNPRPVNPEARIKIR